MTTIKWLEENKKNIIKWRRDLHQIPEIGYLEYETTYYLYSQTKKLNCKFFLGKDIVSINDRLGVPSEKYISAYESMLIEKGFDKSFLNQVKGGYTGIILTFDTQKEGVKQAYRFDIDGLPIHEEESSLHLPHQLGFRSQKDGYMHACGHDGHMAIGLAFAHYIDEHLDELTGTFTLIFQPAEEGTRGAHAVVEKGWLTHIDEFFSLHLGLSNHKTGTIGIEARGFLAASKLNIEYFGQSSHAAISPNIGRNAMIAAANTVLNSYAISRHQAGESRINCGKLMSGSGRNVIPDYAYLEMEIRGECSEVLNYMETQVDQIVKGAALISGVESKVEKVGYSLASTPDMNFMNDLISRIKINRYVKEILPFINVSGSEDATLMISDVRKHGGKAMYSIVGASIKSTHHAPDFDFDESALFVAVSYLIQTIK